MPWSSRLPIAFALAVLVSPPLAAHAGPHRPPHRASPAPAASLDPVVFEAPAGKRPAGPTALDPAFGRILPSGRILQPAGRSTIVGTNALGVALSPDDRYAIVTNASETADATAAPLDDRIRAGYSLAVVDTLSMRVVDVYRAPNESYFAGIVAERDPADPSRTLVLASGGVRDAVFAFDLDAAGRLAPDARHAISLGRPGALSSAGRIYPSTLVLSPRGDRAFAIDNLANAVSVIDVATRTVAGPSLPVGFFPFAATATPTGLLVANQGLMAYDRLASPGAVPAFAVPTVDPSRSSSLTSFAFDADGTLANAPSVAIPLDRPIGVAGTVGGVQPAAIAAVRGRPYAFVALASVDRIATLALGERPHVVGGTELRLFDRGPYGTQPSALALSADGRRLYVALAGIDAVAVLDTTDPIHPHRLGLIPTGWSPSALALAADGRSLFVVNAKGLRGTENWATLERIDLAEIDLRRTTPLALSYIRRVVRAAPNRIVPQRFLGTESARIKHVVTLLEPAATFDSLFGDAANAAAMPNLSALAHGFAFAQNFYADAGPGGAGHVFAIGGVASAYSERVLPIRAARPSAGGTDDPEDYPRAGYLFDSLIARGKSFRDYGDLLGLSGASPGPSGGALYSLDVPGLAALAGRIDLAYPAAGSPVADATRAAEFERDLDPLAKADRMPAFIDVALPGLAGEADADRALGSVVAYLTHLPQWSSTAIFIEPVESSSSESYHAYAIVVSPYAKRGYAGTNHLATVGVLKTEEEILGLPALSLGDALATDLSDFFTPLADPAPFVAAGVSGALGQGDRVARTDRP